MTHLAQTKLGTHGAGRKLPWMPLALAAALALAGCGGKEQKSGQALVSVNGEEITSSQLNEELQRANVPPAQQEAAKKQVLDSLVERQLMLGQAAKDNVEREPQVVRAIERAKAMIVAQAYMQKRLASVSKPTKADIQDYYDKHPVFFAARKVFEMRQLVLATKDMDDTATRAIDSKKSLDEMAAWFDNRGVKYGRAVVLRSGSDLPPQMTAQLDTMPLGKMFIVREGERSILSAIVDVKTAPLTVEQAAPQIEQYLLTAKTKEAAAAEVARLRADAKIEYLNKALTPDAKPAAPAGAPAAAPADQSTARGVAGLK